MKSKPRKKTNAAKTVEQINFEELLRIAKSAFSDSRDPNLPGDVLTLVWELTAIANSRLKRVRELENHIRRLCKI